MVVGTPCDQAPADESGGVTVIWASPFPKTLVIWASPSHTNLAILVRVTGDAHITRVLGMGMPKTRSHITVTAAQETRIGFPEMGSKVLSARHRNNL